MNGFINEDFQFGYADFSSDPAQHATFLDREHESFEVFDPSDPFHQCHSFRFPFDLSDLAEAGHFAANGLPFNQQDDNLLAQPLFFHGLTSTISYLQRPIDAANPQNALQDQTALNIIPVGLSGSLSPWPVNNGYQPDISSATQAIHERAPVQGLARDDLESLFPDLPPQSILRQDLLYPTWPSTVTKERVPVSTPSTQLTRLIPSTDAVLVCQHCQDRPAFTHRHLYNKHRRKHDRPDQCLVCGDRFAFKRDLDRHVASKHPDIQAARRRLYFCIHQGCDRAQGGRKKGFPRKDTLERHLRTHRNTNLDQQESSSSSTTNGSVLENSSTEIL